MQVVHCIHFLPCLRNMLWRSVLSLSQREADDEEIPQPAQISLVAPTKLAASFFSHSRLAAVNVSDSEPHSQKQDFCTEVMKKGLPSRCFSYPRCHIQLKLMCINLIMVTAYFFTIGPFVLAIELLYLCEICFHNKHWEWFCCGGQISMQWD